MQYLAMLVVVLLTIAVLLWAESMLGPGKLPAGPPLITLHKEHYGEPPGLIRAVHRDELGFRGWADMPGDYEGNSASAVSAYVQRSA